MAAVLQFHTEILRARRGSRRDTGSGRVRADGETGGETGRVIIFPGVRVERNGLDLAHRRVRIGSAKPGSAKPGSGESGPAEEA